MKVVLFAVLVGIALIAAGCCNEVCVARTTVNAQRETLAALHEDMKDRYRAEQLEAARAVPGDRSDPAVKKAQQDAVEEIRTQWQTTWSAYRLVVSTWRTADSEVKKLERAEDAGEEPDAFDAASAVADMVEAVTELAEAMR